MRFRFPPEGVKAALVVESPKAVNEVGVGLVVGVLVGAGDGVGAVIGFNAVVEFEEQPTTAGTAIARAPAIDVTASSHSPVFCSKMTMPLVTGSKKNMHSTSR